jgi:hypothetical protein
VDELTPGPISADDLVAVLRGAPVLDKSELTVAVDWPKGTWGPDAGALAPLVHARIITWDPLLDLIEDPRPTAWTSVVPAADDGGPAGSTLTVWIPISTTWSSAEVDHAGAADVVARLVASAVVAGAPSGLAVLDASDAARRSRGVGPDLLSAVDSAEVDAAVRRRPGLTVVSDGWQPIELPTLVAAAESRFGPILLDLSRVRLDRAPSHRASCPACHNETFGFVAELEDARESMCPFHTEAAGTVITRRLRKAQHTNPDGMEAVTEATIALEYPHVPEPAAHLLRRLTIDSDRLWREFLASDGGADGGESPEADVLAIRHADVDAELQAFELLGAVFAGHPEQAHSLVTAEEGIEDFGRSLAIALDDAGRPADMLRMFDILTGLSPAGTHHRAEAAAFAARAGLHDEAVRRVEALDPADQRDAFVLRECGRALVEAGRPSDAPELLRRAVVIARREEDLDLAWGAAVELVEVLVAAGADTADVAAAEAEAGQLRELRLARDQARGAGVDAPQRAAISVGRNDPCPCGSGKKYKRCCGA